MKNSLSLKNWAWMLVAASGLIFLRETSTPAFFFVWNTLIIFYAILLSSFIYAEKYYFLYALLMIAIGAGTHWYEANEAINIGACNPVYAGQLIDYVRQLDLCFNYEESWVLYAQAVFLAGAGVVVIYLVSELYKIYEFFKYER